MAEQNHWKLGLAVALCMIGSYVGLMVLAAQLKKADPLLAVTYLDESAQGLRVDADVQMRGVRIGRVKSFGLAEDGRHVEVICELDDRTLRMLGIRDVHANWGEGDFAPPSLRAFLASTGLTGVLVIQMDFFDPSDHPRPDLGFEPPWNYVPAVTSFAGSVQRDLPSILRALPKRLDQAEEIVAKVEAVLDETDPVEVAAQVRAELADAQRRVDEVDVAEIESRTLTMIADTRARLDETHASLERIEQERSVEVRLEKIEELLEGFSETLTEFDAEALATFRADSAALVDVAREVSEPLEALRAWAVWAQGFGQSWDDWLRPLGEDPSGLLFGEPTRERE